MTGGALSPLEVFPGPPEVWRCSSSLDNPSSREHRSLPSLNKVSCLIHPSTINHSCAECQLSDQRGKKKKKKGVKGKQQPVCSWYCSLFYLISMIDGDTLMEILSPQKLHYDARVWRRGQRLAKVRLFKVFKADREPEGSTFSAFTHIGEVRSVFAVELIQG